MMSALLSTLCPGVTAAGINDPPSSPLISCRVTTAPWVTCSVAWAAVARAMSCALAQALGPFPLAWHKAPGCQLSLSTGHRLPLSCQL